MTFGFSKMSPVQINFRVVLQAGVVSMFNKPPVIPQFPVTKSFLESVLLSRYKDTPRNGTQRETYLNIDYGISYTNRINTTIN